MAAPANDLFADAQVITSSETVTGTTVDATASAEEESWLGDPIPTVWYVYTNSTGKFATIAISEFAATSGYIGTVPYMDVWRFDGTPSDFDDLTDNSDAHLNITTDKAVNVGVPDGQKVFFLVGNEDYNPAVEGGFSFLASVGPIGRVLIAFDDGPLQPYPTWTVIDDDDNLVADLEITAGKQDEFDQTETNKAKVRLNDRTGTFDPNNLSGPYWGRMHGKQIVLQVQNPVDGTWESRFRGLIRNWGYDLDPATRDGISILSNVALDAVGVFDYFARFELIAGVHGDVPPAGRADAVFYEDGEVDTRLIALLTDAGVDTDRYVVFSGNVNVQETLYDSGDPLLTALRDAADAETPSALANIYEDRFGRFVFHGRQAKLDPATVAADAGADAWDYQTFKVGDGAAITDDPDYAQMRPPFNYRVDLADLINQALVIPRGIDRASIPSLVESDATSVNDYGPAPFTYQDSINGGHKTNGDTASEDTNRSSQFLVGNFKNPLVRIETLTVKALSPADDRAEPTWLVLSRSDIADSVRLTVGYPDGTGIDADYFIEGWMETITPLNPDYDMVVLSLNLSPRPTFNPYDDA